VYTLSVATTNSVHLEVSPHPETKTDLRGRVVAVAGRDAAALRAVELWPFYYYDSLLPIINGYREFTYFRTYNDNSGIDTSENNTERRPERRMRSRTQDPRTPFKSRGVPGGLRGSAINRRPFRTQANDAENAYG